MGGHCLIPLRGRPRDLIPAQWALLGVSCLPFSELGMALWSCPSTWTCLSHSPHAAPCPLALPSELLGPPTVYESPVLETEPFLSILAPFLFGVPHSSSARWPLLATNVALCPEGQNSLLIFLEKEEALVHSWAGGESVFRSFCAERQKGAG